MQFPATTVTAATLAYGDPRRAGYAEDLKAATDEDLVRAFAEVSMAVVVDVTGSTVRWDILKAEILHRMVVR